MLVNQPLRITPSIGEELFTHAVSIMLPEPKHYDAINRERESPIITHLNAAIQTDESASTKALGQSKGRKCGTEKAQHHISYRTGISLEQRAGGTGGKGQ